MRPSPLFVQMHLVTWSIAALALSLSVALPAHATADATLSIDNLPETIAAAPPINRRLFGSNIQWTDNGDGLLQAGTTSFENGPLAASLALSPTVLRYPGGGQADVYHYVAGITMPRGTALHVFTPNTYQTVWMGTQEFLDLSTRTGAAPMITLNVITAPASESAAWVHYVNDTSLHGTSLQNTAPRVRDWEVGNEPYFKNALHPELDVSPLKFAKAYDAHVAAILAADPRIRVGLPLLAPNTTRLLPLDQRSFNSKVLNAIHQRVDFVAVHNAYMPFIYIPPTTVPSDEEMLRSVLASANEVNTDLSQLRTRLDSRSISAPFAMTEYSSLMSINMTPALDSIPVSLAGALYAADLLCTLAKRNDMDSAEHWSLINNWYFGAMHVDGKARPVYRALQGINQALNGVRLPVQIKAPKQTIPAFGALPAQTDMPLVSSCVATQGNTVQVVMVNRSTTQSMQVRLGLKGGASKGAMASVKTLNDSNPLQAHYDGTSTPDWSVTTVKQDGFGANVDLPAHSLVIVTLSAQGG